MQLSSQVEAISPFACCFCAASREGKLLNSSHQLRSTLDFRQNPNFQLSATSTNCFWKLEIHQDVQITFLVRQSLACLAEITLHSQRVLFQRLYPLRSRTTTMRLILLTEFRAGIYSKKTLQTWFILRLRLWE